MQREAWPKGMDTIHNLPKKVRSRMLEADAPFLDNTDELIKGGGRLKDADLTFGRKHPTLIPDTELGDALIGYIHHESGHQGRKVNAGVIREYGYSVVGGRKRIQRIIGSCITFKTLRGSPMSQKMADLPEQRLWRTPPFLHCGIDVFGHFLVTDGRHT